MRRACSGWLLAGLVASGLMTLGARPALALDYLKIGAWNIENLGDRMPAQRPIAIAEHIKLSGVDVLCLAEIHVSSLEGGERHSDVLDVAFAMLNEDGDDWHYELFPNRDPDDTTQLCGVAWNGKRVSRVGNAFPIPITDNSIWDRRPHAVKFSAGEGKSDFVVIPVHMKSNADGQSIGRDKREREANALVAQLSAVRTAFADSDDMPENDLLILGDTNILNHNEAANQAFMAANFKDLNEKDRPTFVRGDAPFDRIYVNGDEGETRYARQYILASANLAEHEEALSDHQLVMTVFKIQRDDD